MSRNEKRNTAVSRIHFNQVLCAEAKDFRREFESAFSNYGTYCLILNLISKYKSARSGRLILDALKKYIHI